MVLVVYLITGYAVLIETLELPDPNGRHMPTVAIVGRCDVIVTQNLQDFPEDTRKTYDIEKQQPDDFLVGDYTLTTSTSRLTIPVYLQ